MRNPIAFNRTWLLGVVAAGALVVAACGSSSSDDNGVASLDDPSSGESASAQEASTDSDAALADYQSCMADFGVEFNIEVGDGGLSLSAGGDDEFDPQSSGLGAADPETLDEAQAECGPLLQDALADFAPDPQQEAALADANLRFEECMADQGFDVQSMPGMTSSSSLDLEGERVDEVDPQAGGGFDDPDFDEAGFRAAADTCGEVFDEIFAETS